MFKVSQLADILIRNFNQLGVFGEHVSIKELIVNCYVHHSAKRYIRGKTIRCGYKDWVTANSSGYCSSFDIYCGKSTTHISEPLGCENAAKKIDP